MQELKTYSFPVDHGDFTATVELFYLKSEADKVIAHQKYRRCLAMAKRCNDKIDNPVQYNEHDDWLIITEYWERWHERWLKLAEKFKEA